MTALVVNVKQGSPAMLVVQAIMNITMDTYGRDAMQT